MDIRASLGAGLGLAWDVLRADLHRGIEDASLDVRPGVDVVVGVLEQEIEYCDNLEFFESFWKPFGQPGPGCKICVASFG